MVLSLFFHFSFFFLFQEKEISLKRSVSLKISFEVKVPKVPHFKTIGSHKCAGRSMLEVNQVF